MYCDINCETLTCNRCKRKTIACDVFRNCVEDKIQQKEFKQTKKTHIHKVGTELKNLLNTIGIKATSGCKCNDRATHIDYMEQREPGWSEKNIEEIINWMQEEAKKRKILIFTRIGARLLVKLAIRNAKKKCILCIQ